MDDEIHIIINVTVPQDQEEKDKVTKAKTITKLQIGAMASILGAVINAIVISKSLSIGSLVPIVFNGIGLIGSGLGSVLCTYGIISNINSHQQSNMDSENSNIEGREKTR